ncbi:MAG TPA: hypothetical protein VIK80_09610 [Flavihumibacter sp.]|jgi:hypothetical protein
MEQQFFEDEFEQFLRENADEHRMYPSEGVWTNIYRKLHPGKRRIMITILLLLVLSGLYWLANTSVLPSSGPQPKAQESDENYYGHISTVTVDDIIEKLRAKSLMPPISIDAPVALKPLGITRELRPSLINIPKVFSVNFGYSDQFAMSHWDLVLPRLSLPVYDLSQIPFKPINTGSDLAGAHRETDADTRIAEDLFIEELTALRTAQPNRQPLPTRESTGYKEALPVTTHLAQTIRTSETASLFTPEKLALNSTRKSKWEFGLHFVPSVGYRNLFDSKNWITYGNSPLMVSRLNVNQFVDHKPAVGFELGSALRYRATQSLVFKAGLQLNLTRYSIGAFAHTPEKAMVALNTSFGFRPDTLVATSNVRNIAGNRPERLHNSYMQISLPVGAELKLFGDERLQVNLGGSLQPSYLLNTDQYQLSGDFSNYVSEPSLLRRWNLASSMEVFVTYSAGNVNWQIGPQFRYNLLSTFKKEYPIKENLMEYGLKIGITRPLR